MPHASWSVSGGEAESSLLEQPVQLPSAPLPVRAPTVGPPSALLCEKELFCLVGTKGELALWPSGVAEPELQHTAVGANPVTQAPTLLDSLLMLPNRDRLVCVDLVELTRQSPFSPSRRRLTPVRGEIAAPCACDGKQRLALLARDGPLFNLQVFQMSGGRLQLQWNQAMDEIGEELPGSLTLAGDLLLWLGSRGALSFFSLTTGEKLASGRLPDPPSHHLPVARGKSFYLTLQNGSFCRVWHDGQLQLTPLTPAAEEPLFAWAASNEDAVFCHGRKLRRLELRGGRLHELEVPHYCTLQPWVGAGRALALSQEGTVYALGLTRGTFQVERSLKLEGNFTGATLPPIYAGGSLGVCDADGAFFQVACGS